MKNPPPNSTQEIPQYIALLWIDLNFFVTGPCKVIEQRSNMLKPCVFPFVIDGRRFDKCTSYLDPNQETWCSTKTNSSNDEHVGLGHWGICKEQNCPSFEGK